jgi:hypothetical protein
LNLRATRLFTFAGRKPADLLTAPRNTLAPPIHCAFAPQTLSGNPFQLQLHKQISAYHTEQQFFFSSN